MRDIDIFDKNRLMQQQFAAGIAIVCCIILITSCAKKTTNDALERKIEHAHEAVWIDARSAVEELQEIDTAILSMSARMRWQTIYEHAWLRAYSELLPDTMMHRVTDYFRQHKEIIWLGEAEYVWATEYDLTGQPQVAMEHLKKAEKALKGTEASNELLGAMYYRLGRTSETDMLYEVSYDYYKKALTYLRKTDQQLYLACTLRDLGRTVKDSSATKELRTEYFEEALEHAKQLADTSIYLNILSYAIRYTEPVDNEALVEINRYLCNEEHYHRAASELTEYFLSVNAIDSAAHYLQIFATDTMTMDWSREKYHYLHSRLLQEQGRYDKAHKEIVGLYDARTRQLVEDGKARTFAISQQYDLLQERENTLEKQVKLQHSYLIITILIIVLMVVTALVITLVALSRRRTQVKEQEIARLQTDLQHKRELLRNTLEQRVKLTQELQNAKLLRRSKQDDVPAWAKEFIDKSLFLTDKEWEDFQQQFNMMSDDFLVKLKGEHEALTKVDLQIIALLITGLSITDICVLLNQAKNTIWSRRQRIKNHLGLTAEQQLDEWLQEKYNTNL